MTFRLPLAAPPADEPWHRVDVCDSSVLARTQVSLIGVLDGRAIETIEAAVDLAENNGHTITLDLGQMSSITPDARTTLLARSHSLDDGTLDLPSSPPGQMTWRAAR